MKRIVLAALGCLLLVPGALAQGLADPALEHAAERSARATSSPLDFAKESASKDGLGRERAWAVAYGCFGIDHAHEEYGTPDPRLEECEHYEEALGIEPKKERPEAPVGEAENLTESPLGEAKALVEDADDALETILDEPTSAPSEALGLLGRLVAAVERILSGVVEVLGAAQASVVGLALGIADAVLAGVGSGLEALDGLRIAASRRVDGSGGLVSGIGAKVADGVWEAGRAVSDRLGEAGARLGDLGAGIGSALDGMGSWLGGLFEGGSSNGPSGPSTQDAAGDAVDGVTQWLPCVSCLLE